MNADFVIRPALESEFAQIKELVRVVGVNRLGLDWKRFVVAANPAGEVVACGQLKPHGADILELASIATHPNYRRQGLARRVIAALLEQAPRPLYLMCLTHNRPLYEKFGFQVIEDDLPTYFQRMRKAFGLADVFMRTGEHLLVMKLG
ncbi:MAG: GNAT family N-acetyltransferase [Anaerolineales bacterium]|nr:GNAT family N-acetyltransferase [Anaerolineales bacterium]